MGQQAPHQGTGARLFLQTSQPRAGSASRGAQPRAQERGLRESQSGLVGRALPELPAAAPDVGRDPSHRASSLKAPSSLACSPAAGCAWRGVGCSSTRCLAPSGTAPSSWGCRWCCLSPSLAPSWLCRPLPHGAGDPALAWGEQGPSMGVDAAGSGAPLGSGALEAVRVGALCCLPASRTGSRVPIPAACPHRDWLCPRRA